MNESLVVQAASNMNEQLAVGGIVNSLEVNNKENIESIVLYLYIILTISIGLLHVYSGDCILRSSVSLFTQWL